MYIDYDAPYIAVFLISFSFHRTLVPTLLTSLSVLQFDGRRVCDVRENCCLLLKGFVNWQA
jgi:hypothetical protein